jgi:hypothetical protein
VLAGKSSTSNISILPVQIQFERLPDAAPGASGGVPLIGSAPLTYLDVALTSRASQTSVDTVAGYVDTEVAAIKAKTDLIPAAPAAVGNIPTAAAIATAVLTTQFTESYHTDGTAPTLTQAQMLTLQRLTEFSMAGTAITVKKLDGSSTAAILRLDSSSAPTSSTRET